MAASMFQTPQLAALALTDSAESSLIFIGLFQSYLWGQKETRQEKSNTAKVTLILFTGF